MINALKVAVLVLCLPYIGFSQNNSVANPTEFLQGIWKYNPNTKEPNTEFDAYIINKANKRLFITFWKPQNAITLNTEYWGYLNTEEKNIVNISAFRERGNRFFCVPENCVDDGKIGCVGRNCEIEIVSDTSYALYWHPEPDIYNRMSQLPENILAKIKQNKKQWLIYSNFTGENAVSEPTVINNKVEKPVLPKINPTKPSPKLPEKVEATKTNNSGIINKAKVFIYTSPDVISKMYFIKNDEIKVLEVRDTWVKFSFYNKRTIIGWIKKGDVNLF